MKQNMAYDLADILGCPIKRVPEGIAVESYRQISVNGHPIDVHVNLLAQKVGDFSVMALVGFRCTWKADWKNTKPARLGLLVVLEEGSYWCGLLDLADLPQAPEMFFIGLDGDATMQAIGKAMPVIKAAWSTKKRLGPWLIAA